MARHQIIREKGEKGMCDDYVYYTRVSIPLHQLRHTHSILAFTALASSFVVDMGVDGTAAENDCDESTGLSTAEAFLPLLSGW